MDNYVAVELLMEKTMADEINNKGLAEIALRRTDAKFREMVKCPVSGELFTSNDVVQKVITTALQVNNNTSIIDVRGAIRDVEGGIRKNALHLNQLNSLTKTIALQVDGIYAASNIIQNLAYLNIGLSLANIAVDIVGFWLIGQKINALSYDIRTISIKVDQVLSIEKNKIISNCQKLIMRFNSMLAKIQDGDPIEWDSLDNLVRDMLTFISEMISNMNEQALDTQLLLKMIFTLMPAYTILLKELVHRYYFDKGKLPPNYEIYLGIYDVLTSKQLRTWLTDYYFLDEGESSLDTLDIVNAQILLVLNSRIAIEDESELLLNCETKEEYLRLEEAIDEGAKRLLKNRIPEIAKESGIDEEECRKILLGKE